MTQAQECIKLLVYHIDGILTYNELIYHLSSLDASLIENFPDNTNNAYPPLKVTLRQSVLQAKEDNATNEP